MGDELPKPAKTAPPTRTLDARFFRGAAGAVIGAVAGYAAFAWCMRQGYVILPLPGALIGLGRDLATRHRSWLLGAFCLILALAVQGYIVQTWFMNRFAGMGGFLWGAYVAGVAFALWFGVGKSGARTLGNKE